MEKFTEDQIKRQDFVDNEIYDLVKRLVPSTKKIEWDIEEISNLKQKGLGYEENGLNLGGIDLNPGKSSWKIKGGKKRMGLSSTPNPKNKNRELVSNFI